MDVKDVLALVVIPGLLGFILGFATAAFCLWLFERRI